MGHNVKVSTAAVNLKADAFGTAMNSGFVDVYTAPKPAAADDPPTGATLLGTGTFGNPAFGSASNGVITANAITKDSDADQTGTVAWYRLRKSDGTTKMGDGEAGLTGSGSDLEMPTLSVVQHGEITFPSMTHTESKG